jgi:uncharacterized membrane protein YfcA
MDTLSIVVVLFFAALCRSTFGFGDALVAMPLLSMLVGVRVATPLVALMSVVIAIAILVNDWRKVEFRACIPLVMATAIGIPIGIAYLKGVNESTIKTVLGILIIGFGSYELMVRRSSNIISAKWAWPLGVIAGILGGAYNTCGPPVVIFGRLRQWDAASFRATMQGYFLPTSILLAVFHGLGGLWNQQLLWNFGAAIPVVIFAILIGRRLNSRFETEKFYRAIYVILIVLGAWLVVESLYRES